VTAVDEMYSLDPDKRCLELSYANGDREVLYFKDFASGAMIESIARRAKKLALKRYIQTGRNGLTPDDLLDALRTRRQKESWFSASAVTLLPGS
jgi:proteasome-associated ATPase